MYWCTGSVHALSDMEPTANCSSSGGADSERAEPAHTHTHTHREGEREREA